MKRKILIRKKESKISLSRAFEIITITFLIFSFSALLYFFTGEHNTPTIDGAEEITAVFKESKFHEFLGFDKNISKETEK